MPDKRRRPKMNLLFDLQTFFEVSKTAIVSKTFPPKTFVSTVRRRISTVFFLLTGAFVVALAIATHIPRPETLLGPNPPNDKLMHFIAYASVSLLAGSGMAFGGWFTYRRAIMLIAFLIILGAIDECTQPWFHRTMDVADWVFDCLGGIAGLLLLQLLSCAMRFISPRTL